MNSSCCDNIIASDYYLDAESVFFNDTNSDGTSNGHKFVSDLVAFYFKAIAYVLIGGIVSIVGIISNIVNIIIFVRQGIFTESGSVSLLGLAMADLFCVVLMLWKCIAFTFVLLDPTNLPWDPWAVWYITGGWPNLMFIQISRGVSAYVAFERCICVVLPFKVKSIITPKRSLIIIGAIFVGFGLSHSPIFIEQQLKFRTDPDTNTTRLLLVSSPTWQRSVDIMWYINSLTFNVGSVVIVFFCTIITASRVKLSKTWRESLATGSSSKSDEIGSESAGGVGKQNTMSKSKLAKEKKLVRMITSISFIFLLCYSPDLTFLLMYSINTEIRVGHQYDNLAMVMYCFTFLMSALNSSINIVVYYKMSTRYKEELFKLLGVKTD